MKAQWRFYMTHGDGAVRGANYTTPTSGINLVEQDKVSNSNKNINNFVARGEIIKECFTDPTVQQKIIDVDYIATYNKIKYLNMAETDFKAAIQNLNNKYSNLTPTGISPPFPPFKDSEIDLLYIKMGDIEKLNGTLKTYNIEPLDFSKKLF